MGKNGASRGGRPDAGQAAGTRQRKVTLAPATKALPVVQGAIPNRAKCDTAPFGKVAFKINTRVRKRGWRDAAFTDHAK